MVTMMSRRPVIPKLPGLSTDSAPDDELGLRLEGVALYTDRDGQPMLSTRSPRNLDVSPTRHVVTSRGQFSVIKISPRNDGGDGWQVSPRGKQKVGGRKGQISMIDLQSLTTPRNKEVNPRSERKETADWLKPKRPTFLPPLDMSHLNSKDVSPDSEAPQTPRFEDDTTPTNSPRHTEQFTGYNRQSHTVEETPRTWSLDHNNFETPRYPKSQVHMDMQMLFDKNTAATNGRGRLPNRSHRTNPRLNKYQNIDENGPDDESSPVPQPQSIMRNKNGKMSGDSKFGVDLVTPRDILANLQFDRDNEEGVEYSGGSKAARERKSKMYQGEKVVPFKASLSKERDSSQPDSGFGSISNSRKLLSRKPETKKLLRFNVETDVMQGKRRDRYRKQAPTPSETDENHNNYDVFESDEHDFNFSRPSTAKTDHNTWLPLESEQVEETYHETIERWWDKK